MLIWKCPFYGKNNKKENKQKTRIARKLIICYDIYRNAWRDENMDIAKRITELREEAGESRKEFSFHTGISAEISSILGFDVENE